MALTIAYEGLGVIANADAETNDTGGNGTGDWGFTGSGGVSWGLTSDTFYYGSSSMSMALSGNGKNGWLWFNRGSAIDFSTTYAGEHVYIWVHCPTLGLSATKANIGLGIRMGSSTGNYRTWVVGGSDDSNGWDGAWRCFVIDPTKAGSVADTGTYSAATVQYIGIKGETTATAKGDNFFISQIAVASGVRVTGTSTTGWQELVNYCTDLPNRAYGVWQQREGVYYSYGKTIIGSTAQSSATSFTDSGRVIQYGISEYWNGTAWVTSADIDYSGIVIEDASGFTTTFSDGVIVGSDNGRSGSSITGNANHDVSLDLYGGSNAASVTTLYGTQLKSLTGTIVSGSDADHKVLGVSFISCNQYDPVGVPVIRNCTFAETAAATTDAALLWNSSIDISSCNFIANSRAIEIAQTTTQSFDALFFSGNTYDVHLNNGGTSITVNKNNGADPASYIATGGGVVTFSATFTHTLTNLELNTEITYVTSGTNTELFHVEQATTSDGNGKYQTVYTHSGGALVDIFVHHKNYEPDVSNIYGLTLPNSSVSVKIQMFNDLNYENP